MIFPNSALPHPVDVASIHLREFLLYGSFHYHKSYRNPSFLLHCTTNSPLSAKNLRFLSTGAPAVSFCVEPSVSRRGTCDRKICTKPLARRTRGSKAELFPDNQARLPTLRAGWEMISLGDEAYFDDKHTLHVRKGRIRFYLNLDPIGTFTPAIEKQLKDLASRV